MYEIFLVLLRLFLSQWKQWNNALMRQLILSPVLPNSVLQWLSWVPCDCNLLILAGIVRLSGIMPKKGRVRFGKKSYNRFLKAKREAMREASSTYVLQAEVATSSLDGEVKTLSSNEVRNLVNVSLCLMHNISLMKSKFAKIVASCVLSLHSLFVIYLLHLHMNCVGCEVCHCEILLLFFFHFF